MSQLVIMKLYKSASVSSSSIPILLSSPYPGISGTIFSHCLTWRHLIASIFSIAQNLIVFCDIYLQYHNLIDMAYKITLTGIVLLFPQIIIPIWISWRPLGIPESFVRKTQILIRSKFKRSSYCSREERSLKREQEC